jgi:hypothetical protein
MGLLDEGLNAGFTAVGLGGIFSKSTDTKAFGKDFDNGLIIEEVINGAITTNSNGKIQLVGSFMPLIPFEFGGKQHLSKDYYPGNPEPVMQVLGARESDVTIHGRLKTKRFKDPSMKGAATAYQLLIDAMRKRGNVVKVTLGEWRRYAVIEDASFKLNRLTEIDYSITFSIIGEKMPKNCKIIKGIDDDILSANTTLATAAAAALASARNYPASMPRTLSGFLNDQISEGARVIGLVTGYVDGVLKDIEDINASAHRAVGLIKNARTTIAQTSRRIGALALSVTTLSSGVTSDSFRTAAQFNNAGAIKEILNGYAFLLFLLSNLQAKFASIARTLPISRHLIKHGDTLQNISIRYYNNADLWKNIYDHNLLTSTTLNVGTVLEIPKV